MNRLAALAHYGQIKNDTQAEYASPHQLTLMLFDGAIESLSAAAGAIDRREYHFKSQQMSRAIVIINGLQSSLEMKSSVSGSDLADNLYALYQYMITALFHANSSKDSTEVLKVQKMLMDIRFAWREIPMELHHVSVRK